MRNLPALRLRALCLLVLGSLLGACGYDLYDDVDLTLDFTPLAGPSVALHSPYVKGARFNLFLGVQGSTRQIGDGWRLESEQPGVLALSDLVRKEYEQDGHKRVFLKAAAAALEEGQATITVRDGDGGVVFGSTIEVLRPDRIELLAHGPLLIERPEEQARTPAIQVLTGGTATFLARYFRGDRLLLGNGTLTATAAAADGVTAEVRRTFLFEDRDWLSITPQREGQSQLELLAAGEPVSRVAVTAVSEAALAKVQLSQSERLLRGDAKDGRQEVVLAEALDRFGQPVYGVTYNWSFAGTPQTGEGDLFRYEFKHGMRRMLSAQHGAMAADLMIEAKKGFVDSTNNIGCALGGPGGSGGGLAALVGLAAVGLRRRRRGSKGPGGPAERPAGTPP